MAEDNFDVRIKSGGIVQTQKKNFITVRRELRAQRCQQGIFVHQSGTIQGRIVERRFHRGLHTVPAQQTAAHIATETEGFKGGGKSQPLTFPAQKRFTAARKSDFP